uniref:Ubiquitin associated protein 2a n=1 Tax=Paramormyrops kingsleyae TaxID=1676925 RepID=A0A3B3TBV8_9TELE
IQLAQMIYDTNDADFEDKIKQVIEVTGKNQDECVVALHDCKEDIIKAINFLLEGSSDVTSWETVGRRRVPGKESSSTENKENREKRMDKEASRGRGEANRRDRGANHSREGKAEGTMPKKSKLLRAAEAGCMNLLPESASGLFLGSWQNPLDDWAVEDWNEDVSV